MLEFFRKYQKYFFIFIAVVVITSFSFFGVFSALRSEGQKQEECVIGHLIDGSPLVLSEVQALSHFLATDQEDWLDRGVTPNLCNNGVVRYDFIRNGLADLLVAAHFPSVQGELAARLDRIKRYRFYAHPAIALFNAEGMWERFLPTFKNDVSSLKEAAEMTPPLFSSLSALYQQQALLPPEKLRRILFFQQQQLSPGNVDPRLHNEDLYLFGFHSVADWFGREFLDLVSEFILNAAQWAKQKGFHVTLEEAKGDLLCNFQQAVEKKKEEHIDVSSTLQQHLHRLGFNEKHAVELWRKVLLFRRCFQGIAEASFIDRLPYKEFASYARETAVVDMYQLPAAMRCKTLQDLIEFETYLAHVFPARKDLLSIPEKSDTLEHVKHRSPELVQSGFRAHVSSLALDEMALRFSVKEVWEWECAEHNWAILQDKFSFLPKGSSTPESRFQSLETLAPEKRLQVDLFARLHLLQQHPEWVSEAWAQENPQEQTIVSSETFVSLPHVSNAADFYALLTRAADGDEKAQLRLLQYCDNEKTVYRIENVACTAPEHILTLEEAKQARLLAPLAERFLRSEYEKLKVQYPERFKTKDGGAKLFADSRQDVARLVLEPLYKAIAKEHHVEQWTDDVYAQYRCASFAAHALNALQKNPDDARYVQTDAGIWEQQFHLVRSQKSIQRTDKEKWMKEQAFGLQPLEWSALNIPANGDVAFFYVKEHQMPSDPILEQIMFGKELIVADAQRYLAEKLLAIIAKEQAIVVPAVRK